MSAAIIIFIPKYRGENPKLLSLEIITIDYPANRLTKSQVLRVRGERNSQFGWPFVGPGAFEDDAGP